jgi:hypothetical protein
MTMAVNVDPAGGFCERQVVGLPEGPRGYTFYLPCAMGAGGEAIASSRPRTWLSQQTFA